ncbi:MAG: hypothetical protein LBD18_06755 [Treponema sp.]|jgi:hypothetical protein|nr:hypothetical protein [Treponema sp.]
MLKICTKVAIVLAAFAVLFTLAGCENDVFPTGSIEPRPGAPYGDEEGPLPVFDINNLPSPEFWNNNGHFHNLPDLFTFADGTKVQTTDQWESRRAEINKIIQYYEYGEMPSWPDEITWTDTESGNTITTVIHVKVGSMTRDFTVQVTLPASPKTHNGKIPVMFQSAAANGFTNAQLNNAGYATAGLNEDTLQPEGTYGVDGMTPQAGIVGELYNWQRDINLPSCNIAYAWGMSVIIHVMEQGGFANKLDPKGVMITGMSRYGKAAVVAGAMAESPSGQRVALTVAGSAGMGGPLVERFITPAGLNGGEGDPNYVETFNGAVGKTYYLKALPDSTNSSGANSVIAVKLTDPPTHTATYNGRDEVGWGFIQSHAEGRKEQGGWFNRRFQDFADLHYGVDMDHDLSANPDLGRSKHGWLCTMPFDQHFLVALCAPNGFIFHDGYRTRRNNPESQYLNYLAVKEAYEFLGKGPNVGIRLYDIPHSQPAYEFEDMANFADALFGIENSAKGTNNQADVQADELPLFRQECYPHDDPRSKWDYYRLNWARPGAKSIAQQVREALGE